VGRGTMNEDDISLFLEKYSQTPAKYTAPPSGLFLESISYQKTTPQTIISPVISIQNKKHYVLK
jgi:tRNA pseudouridine38-40 synthase